jgi:hypothetical protein
MTPDEREAKLLDFLADHQRHDMPQWDQLAQGLKHRNVVDYIRTTAIIRLLE